MRGTLIGLSALLLGPMIGCGARSDLLRSELLCERDADCGSSDLCAPNVCQAGQCVIGKPVVCATDNPCLTARCAPETGACEFTSLTLDLDGDGHFATLPGTFVGEEGSCGTDCDDTSARSYLGAYEICDGVDNDCDGTIDNGSKLLPQPDRPATEVVRLASPEQALSGSRGIAFGEGVFALGYRARGRASSENRSFIQGRAPGGALVFPETPVSSVNVGSYGTPLAWSGKHFGAAWQDARSGNYEVYFTLFDSLGNKGLADVQLTETPSSSWLPELIYDQGRFVVVWEERILSPGPQIRAQLLTADGVRLGGNIELTTLDGNDYGFVGITPSPRGYGIVYTVTAPLAGTGVAIEFKALAKDLITPLSPIVRFQPGGDRPRIALLGENFLVTWDVEDRQAIWGALVSPEGKVLVEPRPVTPFAGVVRDNSVLSFGDRVLVSWAEESEGSLDIFGTVIGSDLEPVEPKTVLLGGPGDSVDARLARSDEGYIGMLVDDFREGVQHAHFMAFGCDQIVIK